MAERAKSSKVYREQRQRLEPFRKIASALILRRGELGISQRELARRVGTSATAISRIESGQHPTSVTTLQRLASALDLKLIIDFEKEEQPELNNRRKAAA